MRSYANIYSFLCLCVSWWIFLKVFLYMYEEYSLWWWQFASTTKLYFTLLGKSTINFFSGKMFSIKMLTTTHFHSTTWVNRKCSWSERSSDSDWFQVALFHSQCFQETKKAGSILLYILPSYYFLRRETFPLWFGCIRRFSFRSYLIRRSHLWPMHSKGCQISWIYSKIFHFRRLLANDSISYNKTKGLTFSKPWILST